MKRKFIGERCPKASSQDRQTSNVLYTLDEALQIFIRAKTAEGVRPGTIKGYHEIFRYFRQWLDRDISNINEISADIIRNYISYVLNGGDIFTLQRILDHADIQTTRKYVQMDSEHIREQHNKFSPLRNIIKRNGIRI
ncbi:hypothetical protein [Neobacillus drentensis]|uniref:hypothetical protein n=1 Tax=Neobacillus drentensis TaxID=220684 RepID=UPI00300339B2